MSSPIERLMNMQMEAKSKATESKQRFPVRIFVGNATCENAAGAVYVFDELHKIKEEKNLDMLYIGRTGCSGRCDKEPIVQVMMDDRIPTKYFEMTPEKIRKVVEEHVLNHRVITEWAL